MFSGIGNDIIEIERIVKAIKKYGPKFLDRLFTAKEQQYCHRHRDAERHFAGRFAAKEAISKALGTGFDGTLTWLDIEISNDASGKPVVILSEKMQARYNSPQLHLSISHCKNYATAVAVCYKNL